MRACGTEKAVGDIVLRSWRLMCVFLKERFEATLFLKNKLKFQLNQHHYSDVSVLEYGGTGGDQMMATLLAFMLVTLSLFFSHHPAQESRQRFDGQQKFVSEFDIRQHVLTSLF